MGLPSEFSPAIVDSRCLPGLHLAIVGDDVPDDERLFAANAEHDLLIGLLRNCYQVTDPLPAFLVGFGAIPTDQIGVACQTLRFARLA
jgi:hypothetical protein